MENEIENPNSPNTETEELEPQEQPRNQIGYEIPEYVKEIEKKNAQLFERFKKLEAKLEDISSRPQPVSTTGDAEVDKIIEIKQATEGLDNEEVAILKTLSKSKKISLSEARNSNDFTYWQSGYKQKVEMEKIENNVPPPSTTQSPTETKKALKDMTFGERQKLWQDIGLQKRHKPPEV